MTTERIKPGDLLLHRPTRTTIQVITVDHGRGDLCVTDPGTERFRYLRAEECELQTASSPDEEHRMVMQNANGPNNSRTAWCKQEALRRGWRPIDLTDVTTIAMEEQLIVDGHSIGSIAQLEGRWHWLLEGEDADTHPPVPDRQTALLEVIGGANARRAVPTDVQPVHGSGGKRRARGGRDG